VGDKRCFVIAPIGERESAARRHSDQVYETLIRPLVVERGYEVSRSDKDATPGSITSEIIRHLVEDDLVIADLTGLNPNVMYELAVRHATGLPSILLAEQGTANPFDLFDMRTIRFTTDWAGIEPASAELAEQLDALESAAAFVSPLSHHVSLMRALSSEDPTQLTMAEILKSVEALEIRVQDGFAQVQRAVEPRFVSIPATMTDPILGGSALVGYPSVNASLAPSSPAIWASLTTYPGNTVGLSGVPASQMPAPGKGRDDEPANSPESQPPAQDEKDDDQAPHPRRRRRQS
jgi:hypothetical protein